MKRQWILSLAVLFATTAAQASDHFGVVNFGNCIAESKLGKQEQTSFEALKKQLAAVLEDTEKQLNDLTAKFNDPEFLDGLSPEAEEKMKEKFRTLNDELGRSQNQYYQVMNQANMRVVQTLSSSVNAAADKIAKEKNLSLIVNKDACFYYSPSLDITSSVIAEMDQTFDLNNKKQVLAPAEALESEVQSLN